VCNIVLQKPLKLALNPMLESRLSASGIMLEVPPSKVEEWWPPNVDVVQVAVLAEWRLNLGGVVEVV
jgi:hypothetical protein